MSKNEKMQELIMGNMPGLPQIIQNSMPMEMPRANYRQSTVGLFFGNVKRNQLVKSIEAEAKIAEQSKLAVQSKLDTIHSIVTFGPRVMDTIEQFGHLSNVRKLAERNMELGNTKLELEIYNLQMETKMSELDLNVRERQYNKMREEEGDE